MTGAGDTVTAEACPVRWGYYCRCWEKGDHTEHRCGCRAVYPKAGDE